MPTVQLGNPQPIFNGMVHNDPTAVTQVSIPESRSFDEAIRDVCHDDGTSNTGLWAAHSGAKAPAWVASDSPELEAALAARFGCPAGRPADQ